MATKKELLLKIPEYGQLAVENCIAQDEIEGINTLSIQKKSIQDALISAFDWDKTSEGFSFWNKIFHSIDENE